MKNKQRIGHTWYIKIVRDDQRRTLFIKYPSLEKKFKSLPDNTGGRISVIMAGPNPNVRKMLRYFSEAIGLCSKYHARPWDPVIENEIYVRRSPTAPLSRWPERKKRK